MDDKQGLWELWLNRTRDHYYQFLLIDRILASLSLKTAFLKLQIFAIIGNFYLKFLFIIFRFKMPQNLQHYYCCSNNCILSFFYGGHLLSSLSWLFSITVKSLHGNKEFLIYSTHSLGYKASLRNQFIGHVSLALILLVGSCNLASPRYDPVLRRVGFCPLGILVIVCL